MQLDAPMRARYASEAPELLDAVTETTPGEYIMRRDVTTDYCVKFDAGLCGIHRAKGSGFLGDACHFYPRVTRQLGEQVLMTATPSCPEVVRQALLAPSGFVQEAGLSERLPVSLKAYLPADISEEDALSVHQAFLACADENTSAPEDALAAMISVAHSLERIAPSSWAAAVPFYLKSASARLPMAEVQDADPFNLVHALCGLAVATRKQHNPRLLETVQTMQEALGIALDWSTSAMTLADDSCARYAAIAEAWASHYAAHYAPLLSRWVQLQLSVALFPFAGFGRTLAERISIITVRFATVRLAIACACGISQSHLPHDVVVRIVQSLARVLDHLADPDFSVKVYTEAGWLNEAKLLGLLGSLKK